MKHVVLANLCEDPNLGEKIIFDSFVYVLRLFSPETMIIPLDLLARKIGSAAYEDRHMAYEDRQRVDALSKLLYACCSLIGKAAPAYGMHLKWKVDPNKERRFKRYCRNRLLGGIWLCSLEEAFLSAPPCINIAS